MRRVLSGTSRDADGDGRSEGDGIAAEEDSGDGGELKSWSCSGREGGGWAVERIERVERRRRSVCAGASLPDFGGRRPEASAGARPDRGRKQLRSALGPDGRTGWRAGRRRSSFHAADGRRMQD